VKHTLETAELRHKISVLRDQLESTPPAAPFHPSDYADFATELENLNMGSDGDWSNWVTGFTEVEANQDAQLKASAETTLVIGQSRKDTLMSDVPEEKPSVAGKVIQLFNLVGALIAARPTTAPPTMSPEYQAEGQIIVDHVLNGILLFNKHQWHCYQALVSNGRSQVAPKVNLHQLSLLVQMPPH
jgi:hypothetical protein